MTVSSGTAIDPNALLAILGSSESVALRIREFQSEKEKHDAAYERLQVGTEARAAFDNAAQMQKDAQAFLDKAKGDSDAALKTLGDANRKATQAIDEANAARAGILAERDKTAAEIAQQKADYQEWIETTTAKLDGRSKQLDAALAEAEVARKGHDAARIDTEKAKADAHEAALRSAQAEADFKANAARLQEMIGTLPHAVA